MPFHATSLQHYYAYTILCCCHHYHHQRKQHHLRQKKCQSPVANNRNLHRQTKQSFCCLRHLRHQMPLLPPPDKDTLRDVMPFHATSLQSTSSQEMTYHCMLRHGTAHHNHATAWYAKPPGPTKHHSGLSPMELLPTPDEQSRNRRQQRRNRQQTRQTKLLPQQKPPMKPQPSTNEATTTAVPQW